MKATKEVFEVKNALRNLDANAKNYTRVEKLASDKHSSLLGQFVSYEENEVL